MYHPFDAAYQHTTHLSSNTSSLTDTQQEAVLLDRKAVDTMFCRQSVMSESKVMKTYIMASSYESNFSLRRSYLIRTLALSQHQYKVTIVLLDPFCKWPTKVTKSKFPHRHYCRSIGQTSEMWWKVVRLGVFEIERLSSGKKRILCVYLILALSVDITRELLTKLQYSFTSL